MNEVFIGPGKLVATRLNAEQFRITWSQSAADLALWLRVEYDPLTQSKVSIDWCISLECLKQANIDIPFIEATRCIRLMETHFLGASHAPNIPQR